MIKGAVETLEFFSIQMAKEIEKQGIDVWFWNMKEPLGSRNEFENIALKEECVLVTFNFIGLAGEAQFQYENEISLWEHYGMRLCCIMVDHPMYYFKNLISGEKNLTLFCIDRDHKRFVQTYYPEYKQVYFLPLAGTEISGSKTPYEMRDIDIVFAGNYVPIQNLMPYTLGMDEEIKHFYFDIIQEMISHPDIPIEQELVGRLKKEFPEITRVELLACMYRMIFIDLYVRSVFREKIVCSLADNGYQVLVIGKDWEKAECKCPKNLVMTGQLNSLECLQYMSRARISVNVMPWFKDGAHDRIFNAMLQGCAVVTDSSKYLDEVICEGKEFEAFSLGQTGQICEKVQYLLKNANAAKQIAEAGYQTAKKNHTWAVRAQELLHVLDRKY